MATKAVNNDTDSLGNTRGKWTNAEWRVGGEFSPTHVAATNQFVEGDNILDRKIGASLAGAIRADFSFSSQSREGILYKGLYQGVGVGVTSFLSGNRLLGTPVSLYVYQGAPIVHLNSKLWLGYEWQFGAAMGWKHDSSQHLMNPSPVSTAATAQLGLGVKIHYAISDRWEVSAGAAATHFSNGNTSWPNRGVNVIGASIGVAYTINPHPYPSPSPRDYE
ncbi:MAG: acyloxyacyl hydrolase [Muribaculaceae bacterium]|nr:acyloxyacyl hydrolase [Muribaculaceae bacterium]